MDEFRWNLPGYLSLKYNSQIEQDYIVELQQDFFSQVESGSYRSALITYHLLFMCYINQVLYKTKLWKTEDFKTSLIHLGGDLVQKLETANSPTAFSHKDLKERSSINFLSLYENSIEVIKKAKTIVDFRNQNLGHATYTKIDEDQFYSKISEYNEVVTLIANLYQKALLKELDSFVANTSAEIKEYVENGEDSEDNLIENISMDEIELAFTAPNYLSYQDLFSLCTLIPDEVINSLDNKKYYLKLRELLTVYLKDVLP
jgi:hypothetical protein